MKAPALVTMALSALLLAQDDPEPAPIAVGDAAPAFRLNDHEGDAVAIGGKGDGWTVLAFYPKAMTPG